METGSKQIESKQPFQCAYVPLQKRLAVLTTDWLLWLQTRCGYVLFIFVLEVNCISNQSPICTTDNPHTICERVGNYTDALWWLLTDGQVETAEVQNQVQNHVEVRNLSGFLMQLAKYTIQNHISSACLQPGKYKTKVQNQSTKRKYKRKFGNHFGFLIHLANYAIHS